MNLKQIKSTTLALFLAGLFLLGAGIYTSNGGFQLAGGILLMVAAILALNQASNRTGNQ